MKEPIRTSSIDEILDIVEEECGSEIPRDDVKDRLLQRNRKFYREASDSNVAKEILIQAMTAQNIMDMSGFEEASEDIESTIRILKQNVKD